MCYTGGPYCYSHMSTRLDKARNRIEKNPTPAAKKSLSHAVLLYDSTPQGHAQLIEQIKRRERISDEERTLIQRLKRSKQLQENPERREELMRESENHYEEVSKSLESSKNNEKTDFVEKSTLTREEIQKNLLESMDAVKDNPSTENKQKFLKALRAYAVSDEEYERLSSSFLKGAKKEPASAPSDSRGQKEAQGGMRVSRNNVIENPPAGYKEDSVIGAYTTVDENGKTHSFDDKPALIYKNGAKIWMKHGVFHRDGDNPSLVHPNGRREYRKDGVFHREGGKPAVITPEGEFKVYENGKLIKQTGHTIYRDMDDGRTYRYDNVPDVLLDKMNNFSKAKDHFGSRGYDAHDAYMPAVVSRLEKNDHRGAVEALDEGFERLRSINHDTEWYDKAAEKDYLKIEKFERENKIL